MIGKQNALAFFIDSSLWGRSSVGRAPALQAGGQEFESLRLHFKNFKKCEIFVIFLLKAT